MKKQTLMLLGLGTLLFAGLLTFRAEAQVHGCIARPGEICEPPGYSQPVPPPYYPDQPHPPRWPDRPHPPRQPSLPDQPEYSFEIRLPVNEWVYGYRRYDLGRMINLWQYQGFRILEVSAVASTTRGVEGYLELLLDGSHDSSQRVVYRDPFMYRLPVWGYRTIGYDVRWLELGVQDAHVVEIRVRLSRN